MSSGTVNGPGRTFASYKACDVAGHRNHQDTPVGAICIQRFKASPCYGRVEEYWEPATPLRMAPTWPRLQAVVDWIANVRRKLNA